jgi:hypothetical protein
MKKLLVITASLLTIMSTTAHADTIPNDVLGKWCSTADSSAFVEPTKPGAQWEDIMIRWDSKCNDTSITMIKKNGFVAWESSCTFTSVRTKYDPSIDSSTKTMGVNVGHVDAKCGGEGCTWRSKFVVYVSKGMMYMRGRNTEEKCDG